MSSSAAARVRAAIETPVAATGCDLEDVEVRRAGSRQLVSVAVDRDGGISLDDVAEVSRVVSEALDAVDVLMGSYVLEVGSPGVDRPLTEARHWRRNVGRLVAVHRTTGATITGRLTAADADAVLLDVNGTKQVVPLGEVSRGVVQVEFARETTP